MWFRMRFETGDWILDRDVMVVKRKEKQVEAGFLYSKAPHYLRLG